MPKPNYVQSGYSVRIDEEKLAQSIIDSKSKKLKNVFEFMEKLKTNKIRLIMKDEKSNLNSMIE